MVIDVQQFCFSFFIYCSRIAAFYKRTSIGRLKTHFGRPLIRIPNAKAAVAEEKDKKKTSVKGEEKEIL